MLLNSFDFTLENIKRERENFKKDEKLEGINIDGDFPGNEKISLGDVIEIAIRCAKGDLMVRTLGHPIKEDFSKEEFVSFKDNLEKYFCSPVKDEKDFNTWHNEVCKKVLNKIREYYSNAKYGKAQKLVNMTFKYLYCLNNKDLIDENYFEFCHMPIDSIVLEWIKREMAGTDFRLTKVPSWSNLEHSEDLEVSYIDAGFYTYDDFVGFVKGLINNYKNNENHLTPLRAEFVIWPQMRMKLAAEEFIKQLKKENEVPKEVIEDPKKASLEENLKIIKSALDSLNM